jgi:hypothetical protein
LLKICEDVIKKRRIAVRVTVNLVTVFLPGIELGFRVRNCSVRGYGSSSLSKPKIRKETGNPTLTSAWADTASTFAR